jgi:hypothetical protein
MEREIEEAQRWSNASDRGRPVKEETEHRSPETATAPIDSQWQINAVRARRVKKKRRNRPEK